MAAEQGALHLRTHPAEGSLKSDEGYHSSTSNRSSTDRTIMLLGAGAGAMGVHVDKDAGAGSSASTSPTITCEPDSSPSLASPDAGAGRVGNKHWPSPLRTKVVEEGPEAALDFSKSGSSPLQVRDPPKQSSRSPFEDQVHGMY